MAGRVFEIAFQINASMQGNFPSTMSRSARVMQMLGQQSRTLAAQQRQLDAAWNQSNAAIRNYQNQLAQLANQYQRGQISASQFQSSSQRITEQMNRTGMSAEEYRNHLQRLRAQMEQTRQAQDRLRAATAEQQAAQSRFSAATAGVMSAGMNVAIAAAPLAGAIGVAANFEAAMSKVQAITRSSGEDMQLLTSKARELGETTQFSATQAAEAMSYLGMAGWDASQIVSGMPGLLALAAAGGTDLARTADIVSDDLTAFGLGADQAGHMADVFAVTVTRTNTNVEMLGETMKYAAPVAHAFGASMEETSALAGIMANSGIKASQAGTALRSGFLRLAGPPKMAQKAMAELGMSMSDITAQQNEAAAAMQALGISMSDDNGPRKMSAILTELQQKTADLGREEKLATLKAIFGTEAATGWLAVLDAGPDVLNDLVSQMENCDGEAEKMAAVMNDNAKGAAVRLQSAMESVAISVGNAFLPMLASAADSVAKFAGQASQWAAANPGIVQGVAAVGAALAGLYMYIKITTAASAALQVVKTTAILLYQREAAAAVAAGVAQNGWASVTRIITAAQWALNAAMAANPVGLVIAGIVALIAAGYMLYTHFEEVQAFMAQIWESPAAAVLAFINPVFMLIYLASGIISNWETVKAWFVTLWNDPKAALTQFAGFIGGKISGVMNTVKAALSSVAAAIGAALSAAFNAFVGFVASIPGRVAFAIGFIVGIIVSLPGRIMAAIEAAGEFLMNLPNYCMAAGTAFVAAAEAWLSNAYTSVVTWISNTVTEASTFLMNLPTACAEAGAQFVAAAKQWASEAYNAVMNWINQLPDAISSAIGGAWEGIKAQFSAGFNIGVSTASNAEGGIYQKGAFLTTFAEEGPEAAIPLTPSPRAIGLWQRAGEMLGVLGGSMPATPALAMASPVNALGMGEYIPDAMYPEGAQLPKAGGITDGDGGFVTRVKDLLGSLTGGATSITNNTTQAPSITLNMNFYGPTDAEDVKQAGEQAGRAVQRSFAEEMAAYERERRRRSYV